LTLLTDPVRTRGWAPRLLIAALSVLAGCAGPSNRDPARWIGSEDTAPGDGLRTDTLRFRPDGLLESTQRIKHWVQGGGPWTPWQSMNGTHLHLHRLIDCETGFSVPTGQTLVDRHGRALAHQPEPPEWRTQRLITAMRTQEFWPLYGAPASFVACALATKPAPEADDTSDIDRRRMLHYDFEMKSPTPPDSAAGVFQRLRQQYAAWRTSFNPAYRPAPDLPVDAATQQAVRQRARDGIGAAWPDAVTLRGSSVLDYVVEAPRPEAGPAPREAAHARSVTAVRRIDCESGLDLPMARQWRDAAGRVVAEAPVGAAEARAQAQARYGEAWVYEGPKQVTWNFVKGPTLDSTGARACAMAAHLIAGLPPADADPARMAFSFRDWVPFGLSEQGLARDLRHEALLLSARAAWHTHRARSDPGWALHHRAVAAGTAATAPR
jgi:hypothetical protein